MYFQQKTACGHKGDPLVVEGVTLSCCDGPAKSCKVKEFARILKDNESLEEHVNFLEERISQLEKQIANLQNKPTTVNNYVHIQNLNVNAILNNDVALELIQGGIKGKNIYDRFYEICQKSNTQEAKSLVNKINSGQKGQIEVKKDILRKLEDVSASDQRVPKRFKKDIDDYINREKMAVQSVEGKF